MKNASYKVITVLCVMVLGLLGINATINSEFDGVVRLTDVELVNSDGNQYVSFELNIPVKDMRSGIVVNQISDGKGWVGEAKQDIGFLGSNIVEVFIYDIEVAKSLIDMEKTIIHGNLGYASLNEDIKFMISCPPDDAITAIYIGSSNNVFGKAISTQSRSEKNIMLRIKD